jgi:hypothetical protein
MNKKEIVSFMRKWAYANIFFGPFTNKDPISASALSLASLAFLYLTDRK